MKKQTFGKTALSLAIAISVGSLASQAMAQNNAVAQNGLVTEKVTTTKGSLVEVGTPQSLSNLKGFAKDLPLIAVLKQITPNEWVVKKAKGKNLDLQKQVSWTGGKNWVETLKEIAENNKIEAVVNWDKKEVVLAQLEVKEVAKEPVGIFTTTTTEQITTVTPVVAPPAKTIVKKESVGVFELANDVIAEGSSGQTSEPTVKKETVVKVETKEIKEITKVKETVVAEPVKVIPPAPVVVAKSWGFQGLDNLKEVVEAWGKKAGYKVVYTGENYPIDKEDPRVFGGEFDGEDGPIKQLSIDYGPQSRVQRPLSFIFFQNRTLVVEDLKYEQSAYPQYIQK